MPKWFDKGLDKVGLIGKNASKTPGDTGRGPAKAEPASTLPTRGIPVIPSPGDTRKPDVAILKATTASGDEPFKLAAFDVSNVKADSNLARAQQALHKALEELEVVLRKVRGSDQYMPNPQTIIDISAAQPLPLSFSEVARDLERSRNASQESVYAKVGSFMAALYPAAKFVIGITSFVAGTVGYVPLAIAANGLGQVLDILAVPGQRDDTVISGLDLLLQDQHLLNQLQKFPQAAVDETILLRALQLQTALANFICVSVLWLRKNYVLRLVVSSVGLEDVQGAITLLQSARDALRTSTSDDLYLTWKRRDLEALKNEELDKLCSRNEISDHLTRQAKLHETRLPDSGLSVVKSSAYAQWCSGKIGSLWCPGLAGAGKTFSASAVIDDLELKIRGHDIGLAYFFCSFERRQRQSRETMLASLTRQLLTRKPEILHQVTIHGELPTIAEREQLFISVVKSFQHVFIVIDALDEFSTDQNFRVGLASTLVKLRDDLGSESCRICVTSREANDIFTLLSPAIRVPVRAAASEISRYVEREFLENDDNRYARAMAQQDSKLITEVTETILSKSDRIFKLASLQVTEVLHCTTPDDVREKLANLTSDIDDYYQATMDRINEKRDRETVLRLLAWVVYSKETVKGGYLRVALGKIPVVIDADILKNANRWLISDLQYYISACEGLIAIPLATNESAKLYGPDFLQLSNVSLAHETVDRFFRSNPALLIPNPHCVIIETYFRILRALRAYTIFEEKPWNAIGEHRVDSVEFFGIGGFEESSVCSFYNNAMAWGEYVDGALREDETMLNSIESYMSFIDSHPSKRGDWQAIHHCAFNSWYTPLQLLLKKGADPNAQCRLVESAGLVRRNVVTTPFWLCLTPNLSSKGEQSHLNMLELLLSNERLDVNLCTRNGHTPLSHCLVHSLQFSGRCVAELLLDRHDIDVNLGDSYGVTPLMHLISSIDINPPEVLSKILNHPDIDVNKRDSGGQTALIATANLTYTFRSLDDCKRAVRSLLAINECDVNAHDRLGRTALHYAARGHYEMCGSPKTASAIANFEIRTLDSDTDANDAGISMEDAAEHSLNSAVDFESQREKANMDSPDDVVDIEDAIERLRNNRPSYTVSVVQDLVSLGSRIHLNVPDLAGRTPLDYAMAGHDFAKRLCALIAEKYIPEIDLMDEISGPNLSHNSAGGPGPAPQPIEFPSAASGKESRITYNPHTSVSTGVSSSYLSSMASRSFTPMGLGATLAAEGPKRWHELADHLKSMFAEIVSLLQDAGAESMAPFVLNWEVYGEDEDPARPSGFINAWRSGLEPDTWGPLIPRGSVDAVSLFDQGSPVESNHETS